ncbi:MAG TPA: GNAT family protein [Methylocella sp.]|nr:GNAT family protein [Methylocella sp.]
MAFFRFYPTIHATTFVRGAGIYLRPPDMGDYEAWANLRAQSRAFLTPWEPTWPADDLTRPSFRSRVRRNHQEIANDEAYPFLVFRDDDVLAGGLTLGQIKRGVVQAGTLGYWIGAPYARQRLMSAAVRAVAVYAFATLRLHRIEASCLPHNEASIKLLERTGFIREGYARSYLRINGVWQDHLLYGLLETDPVPLRVTRPKKV